MAIPRAQLWAAHIDYIRGTYDVAETEQDILGDLERARRATLAEMGPRAEAPARWATGGYYGSRQENICIGTRNDSILLQASGVVADALARRIPSPTRVPRLDLAVTVWFPASPALALDLAERSLLAHKPRGGGRRPSVRRVSTHGEGDTLYAGRRGNSSKMLRVYEKGPESKSEVYENSLRYEFELSDEYATSAFHDLVDVGFSGNAVFSAVARLAAEWSVRLPVATELPQLPLTALPRQQSSLETRIRWLENSVAPSLELLRDNGYRDEEIAAMLGLVV